MQFIPPPGVGKKLNLPGAPMAGVFTVGDMVTGGTAYLCEGIGQAWACWKATGHAAVVCFGWGRVRGVATELRKRDASARLVVMPDVGKEQDAETIARKIRGRFVMLPEGWAQNADVNDYAQREGSDALEALLSAPLAPEQHFKLLGSADLHALPPLAWRVRGVLPALGLGSVYGPSGSGKSFLALDLAAAIAEDRSWFGYRVTACPVVYVCLEGTAGFRLRVAAWERHHGRALPAGLHLVLQPFKLTAPQDVQDMAAAVLSAGNGAVTFIDTLNAAAPGIDENASRDMGLVLEAAKSLQTSRVAWWPSFTIPARTRRRACADIVRCSPPSMRQSKLLATAPAANGGLRRQRTVPTARCTRSCSPWWSSRQMMKASRSRHAW